MKQKNKRTRRQNKRIKTSINKSKCLKWVVKKNTTYLIKWLVKFISKNSKENLLKRMLKNKMQKRTDNKSITAKQVVNKLIAQISICADCGSKKSVFIK